MMSRLRLTLFLFSIAQHLQAQQDIREQVYCHLSSYDVLVGETIYFDSYVTSATTGKWSRLSRLLYVELLDDQGSSVYQTKVMLKEGLGGGHFYLPSSLETGTYQFVAYTRWMKNFNDYFRQPLTVINPYFNPKFTTPVFKIDIQLASEGGPLIAGMKSKLIVGLTDSFHRGLSLEGKIVSDLRDLNEPMKTDAFGLGSVSITPMQGEQLQLVLDVAGRFEFHQLPKVEDMGVQLQLVQEEDVFAFHIFSNMPQQHDDGELQVFRGDQRVFASVLAPQSTLSIRKDKLPVGLLRAEWYLGESEKKQRLFWNGPLPVRERVNFGTFSPLDQVQLSFELPDTCLLSVSVVRSHTMNPMASAALLAPISEKTSWYFTKEFFNEATAEQLDQVLLLSREFERSPPVDQVHWLPEYRLGIVQGRVVDREKKGVENIALGLAFSGVEPQISTTVTDSLGRFVMTYHPEYEYGEPFVAILSSKDSLMLVVDPDYYDDYPVFQSPAIRFDSASVADVVQRSIHNQIQDAYYDPPIKQLPEETVIQFYNAKTYELSEYTRFPTMRDTFIELISEVGVSKNENINEFKLRSKDAANGLIREYPTLLLLDGAFVRPAEVMQLSPYLVQRITVVNHRYFFGQMVFDGVIAIQTMANDRADIKPMGASLALTRVQTSSIQRQAIPSPEISPRLPQYHEQLYWQSAVRHEGGPFSVSFYTGQVRGVFEVRVEGWTASGRPMSRCGYITVK